MRPTSTWYLAWSVGIALTATTGCEPNPAAPEIRRVAPVVSAALARLQPPDTRKQTPRFKACPVYVDGELRAVLTHGELPPGFEPTLVDRGGPFPLFNLADYVARLGVDLERIREVHLVGGRRPAILTGEELLRVRDVLHFAFTRATTGKPRMDWPNERVESSTKIDLIQTIAIYVERPPPTWNLKGQFFRTPDGGEHASVPYVSEADRRPQGTRAYVDGRIVAVLRARDLDPNAPMPLADVLDMVGAPARVRGVDVVAGDDVVVRVRSDDRSTWPTFHPIRGRGGGGGDRSGGALALDDAARSRISALLVYADSSPAEPRPGHE